MSIFDNPNYALSISSNDLKFDASSLILMDLNDDCLRLILDNLGILELANIRNVCQRFSTLADRCRFKYETFESDKFNKEQVYDILEYLGAIVKVLEMDERNYNFDAILKFCPNVESLTLKGLGFKNHKIIRNLKSVAKQLKYLCLRRCQFNDKLSKCLVEASKLEHLEILCGVPEITTTFFQNISVLKCLKTLKLDTYYDNKFIDDIVNHLARLKHLTLIFSYEVPTLTRLSDLPALKILVLETSSQFSHQSINKINLLLNELSKKNSIDDLSIFLFDSHDLDVNAISKLTNLKKLCLNKLKNTDLVYLHNLKNLDELNLEIKNLSSYALLGLIKALPNLKKIRLNNDFVPTFKFIKELIEMMEQQRRTKLEMNVRHITEEYQKELIKLLLRYQDLLEIPQYQELLDQILGL